LSTSPPLLLHRHQEPSDENQTDIDISEAAVLCDRLQKLKKLENSRFKGLVRTKNESLTKTKRTLGVTETGDSYRAANEWTDFSPSDRHNPDLETILQSKTDKHGNTLFLCKWDGYGSDDNTWETKSDLLSDGFCKDVEDFEAKESVEGFEANRQSSVRHNSRSDPTKNLNPMLTGVTSEKARKPSKTKGNILKRLETYNAVAVACDERKANHTCTNRRKEKMQIKLETCKAVSSKSKGSAKSNRLQKELKKLQDYNALASPWVRPTKRVPRKPKITRTTANDGVTGSVDNSHRKIARKLEREKSTQIKKRSNLSSGTSSCKPKSSISRGVSLSQLVGAGILIAGRGVISVIAENETVKGDLLVDGTIVYKGGEYSSPTPFALAVVNSIRARVNKKPFQGMNGWAYCMYKGVLLSKLRECFTDTSTSSNATLEPPGIVEQSSNRSSSSSDRVAAIEVKKKICIHNDVTDNVDHSHRKRAHNGSETITDTSSKVKVRMESPNIQVKKKKCKVWPPDRIRSSSTISSNKNEFTPLKKRMVSEKNASSSGGSRNNMKIKLRQMVKEGFKLRQSVFWNETDLETLSHRLSDTLIAFNLLLVRAIKLMKSSCCGHYSGPERLSVQLITALNYNQDVSIEVRDLYKEQLAEKSRGIFSTSECTCGHPFHTPRYTILLCKDEKVVSAATLCAFTINFVNALDRPLIALEIEGIATKENEKGLGYGSVLLLCLRTFAFSYQRKQHLEVGIITKASATSERWWCRPSNGFHMSLRGLRRRRKIQRQQMDFIEERWKDILIGSRQTLHMFFSHGEGSKSCFWISELEDLNLNILNGQAGPVLKTIIDTLVKK